MRQLVLDIRPDAPPTLDNFVVGDNEELLAALRALAGGSAGGGDGPRVAEAGPAFAPPAPAAHLYLWGAPGSGRTHLLRATVAAAASAGRPAHYVAAPQAGDRLPETPGLLLAIDGLDALEPASQIALFNSFNRARGTGQTLLLAGAHAPLHLALREDLRTRVGQCLIYEVRPLDDQARAAILGVLAERRGLHLAEEVSDFLLRHGRRDLPSLLTVLDALDAASLERKRGITLPLLRDMMRAGLKI